MSEVLALWSPLMLKHDPGGAHPESPGRLSAVIESLMANPIDHVRLECCERLATRTELLAVHGAAYVDSILDRRGRPGALEAETILSAGSVDAALSAAGVATEMSERLVMGVAARCFALVRPPGHHAHPSHASGYCVFNNVSLAATRCLALGARRVVILDWDVHRGDGTFACLEAEPRTAMASIHEESLFPREADPPPVREPSGRFLLSVALPQGAGDVQWTAAFRRVVAEATEFSPDVVLVSAGFDAHQSDPMSDTHLTEDGFSVLLAAARDLAERSACGRIGLVLEGGYDYASLVSCVRRCLAELAK